MVTIIKILPFKIIRKHEKTKKFVIRNKHGYFKIDDVRSRYLSEYSFTFVVYFIWNWPITMFAHDESEA